MVMDGELYTKRDIGRYKGLIGLTGCSICVVKEKLSLRWYIKQQAENLSPLEIATRYLLYR